MSKLLLIDGDMIAHRAARSCEPTKIKPYLEPLDEAIFRANDLLYRIINTCSSNEYRVFLSGSGNFRKLLYPEYKANRSAQPPATHLDAIRELLVREWGAEICDGYEADDGIGMAHSERTIVVSNDKDFRQLEGEIFNPIRNGGEFEVLDSLEAARAFYSLMLEGDTSDNVRGVDGIGKARAPRILAGKSPTEMHTAVFDLYNDPRRFILTYRLLRILRTPEEYEEIMAEIESGQDRESYTDTQDRESYSEDEATISQSQGEESPEEST